MTISNTSRTAGPFVGNGIIKAFPFSFKVFDRADLLVATTVTATGAETILALDADYTVTLNSDQESAPGGVIYTTTPLATGKTLAATSNIAIEQTLDLTNQGGFHPRVINTAMDRIVIMVQQLAAKIGSGGSIGVAAQIAMVLAFIQNLATAAGASLVGFMQAGIGAVLRTMQDKARDVVSVKDFGAKGDGVTDDTAAFLAAIAYCMKAYGLTYNTIDSVTASKTTAWLTLYIPAGLYVVNQTLKITAPMNVIGDGQTSTKIIKGAGFVASSNNAIMDISRADGHWLLNQKIAGFTVIDGTKTFRGVYGKYMHDYSFDDIAACGCSIGFSLDGSYSGRIGRLSLYGNILACSLRGLYAPSTQEANDIRFDRLEIFDADIGLEVGGGLNIHVSGLIQKTKYEAVKVVDRLALLDLYDLYIEDYYYSLPDYNPTAFAISTPPSGSGYTLGMLIIQKCPVVSNHPVVSLGAVLNAVITDNYWHNSTTCVVVAANSALVTLEYKRNYLKRGAGNAPQEFYGYILVNNSPTLAPELLASDFITGNSATDPNNVNFAYGFSGQITSAKPGKLIPDVMVPFPLTLGVNASRLKRIEGRGPGTGFDSTLRHYVLDNSDLVMESFKFRSSANTQSADIGDTATGCYIGGTYNTVQRLAIRNVTFENTAGVNAVEFGRNMLRSTVESCYLITSAANKAAVFSKNSVFVNVSSNDDAAGTASTNVQTQGNAFINMPCVGAVPAGTGNKVV